MATIPITLPTGKNFFLPAETFMLKEISEIEIQIGVGPSIPLPAPSSAATACLYAFLAVLGNGVLSSIKVFLNVAIAEYGVLILALKAQVIQATFLQNQIIVAEQAALNAVRNTVKAEVNNIENMVGNELAKNLRTDQAVVAQQLISSLQANCPPVREFFSLLSANLSSIEQLLAEINFSIVQDTALLNTLNLALAWAESKQRYFKWYVNAINFVVASR